MEVCACVLTRLKRDSLILDGLLSKTLIWGQEEDKKFSLILREETLGLVGCGF